MKYFTQQLLENVHQELLVFVQGEGKSEEAKVQEARALLELLMKAHADIKFAVLPQLPLELAVIEWVQKSTPKGKSTEVMEEVIAIDDGVVSVSSLRKKVGNIKKITAMYGDEKKSSPKTGEKEVPEEHKVTLLQTANSEITKEWLNLLWTNLISEMRLYNHTIAGVLRGCRINGYDKNILVIETAYKFHKERLTDVKTMRELSRIAKLLTGKDIKVEVQLKGK